jgi:hypothetical protein
MGQRNPFFPRDHGLSKSSGETSLAFPRLAETEEGSRAGLLADSLTENPPFGWEAAWIDLGGEG